MKKFAVVFVVLAVLLGLGSVAVAGPDSSWSRSDTVFEITALAIRMIDYGQTLDIAKNPDRYHELNPILGRHPSVGRVHTYFVTSQILHPVISYCLPKKYRRAFQMISIGMSSGLAIHNYNVGLRINF